MFKISKQFQVDYGHRVWTQTLDDELAKGRKSVCRHLHGHTGHIEIHLQAETLKNDMVVDFCELAWFKEVLDDLCDHKFIIDKHDPLFHKITDVDYDLFIESSNTFKINDINYSTFSNNLSERIGVLTTPLEVEHASSFTIVKFVPTSENLCKWIYEIVDNVVGYIFPETVTLSHVLWKETPKTQAIYIGN